jgi:hypothetical protein
MEAKREGRRTEQEKVRCSGGSHAGGRIISA